MYSWAGQLYTALRTVYQLFKPISAGLTGLPGVKNAYIFLPTNYWNFFLPTNCTNFRASECKTELVRVMPSAAENVKEMDTNRCNGLNGDRVGRTNWH